MSSPDDDQWTTSGIVWYSFAIVTNALHLIILLKLKDIRKKPNGKVIISVCITDLCMSLLTIMETSGLHEMAKYDDIKTTMMLNIFWESTRIATIHRTYFVCAFGSYERFIALCHPFRHPSDKMVKNIGKAILLLAIVLEGTYFGLYVLMRSPNKSSSG